jgi:hypothetical protein
MSRARCGATEVSVTRLLELMTIAGLFAVFVGAGILAWAVIFIYALRSAKKWGVRFR